MRQVSPQEAPIAARELSQSVFSRLQKQFDEIRGGFGEAPKFPSPAQTLYFLARYAAMGLSNDVRLSLPKDQTEAARDMAVKTLIKIYNGGIHDFVGGGFSRYSVDERWHVPHCKCASYLLVSVASPIITSIFS